MPFDGTQSPITMALTRARALVEKGWIQKCMRSRDGVCIMGAVEHLAENLLYQRVNILLIQAITEQQGRKMLPAEYNDTPDRTKEEVLAVYDRAIELSFR